MSTGQRGRPRKERPYKPRHASIDTIRARVEREVAISQLCARLSNQREDLVQRLTEAAAYYAVTLEGRPSLKRVVNKVRGNKPAVHTQNLLLDCEKAWSDFTGEADSLWANSQGQEGVGVHLARICVGAVAIKGPGRPYAGDLTRQVDAALDLKAYRAQKG